MGRDLIDRYQDRLHGVLSCYDRIVVTGTLPQVCYAEGMTAFLKARGVRIFDYARFAEPLRDAIRARAQEFEENRDLVRGIIAEGNEKARDVARQTLEEVHQAMGMNYR